MVGTQRGSTLFLFRLPLRQEGEATYCFEGTAACCFAGARQAGNACGQSDTAEGSCHSAKRRCRIKTGLCLAGCSPAGMGPQCWWVPNLKG